jgi:hypothetical protein
MSLARLPFERLLDRFIPALFLALGMSLSAAFAAAVGL